MDFISDQSKIRTKSRRSSNSLMRLGVLLLFLAVIIIVLFFLLRGKETTTGEYPNPIEIQSLICTKKNAKYPKIMSPDSDNKTISVTAIFNGTTELRQITLDYKMLFQQKADVEQANAVAHASFSEELAKDKFSFTEFDNKFSSYNKELTISVFGEADDISSKTRAAYFMIDTWAKDTPKTLNDYRKIYEAQYFECSSTIDE